MSFTTALARQEELIQRVGEKLAHLTFGVGLFLQEADLLALAADGITEDTKDRKIDFMILDEDSKRLVFAQGYNAEKVKDNAPANKASDLNTASAWLVTGDLEKISKKLRQKVEVFREKLKNGDIVEIDLLYVHNCQESIAVDDELKTVASYLAKATEGYNVEVRAHELGAARLDHLYSSQNSFIEVTDTIVVDGYLRLLNSGTKWKGGVTSIKGTWIKRLVETYGEKLYSANYRGFLGAKARKSVNAGMTDTINSEPDEFWAYNNGITVLTKNLFHKDGKITLNGVSIINGAQTSGTIGLCSIDPQKDISLLCRIIESNDEETIKKIVRFNNTQNAITSWDQYANDEQQKRLEDEFSSFGVAYLKKRGFAVEGERITIDSVFQPVLAFHGRSRDAVRGKNQLFQNITLYEDAFSKTKARHILLVYAIARAIDRVRLALKLERSAAEEGLTDFDENQLRLLTNLNFKPFLIDVIARTLEVIRKKHTDRREVAFSEAAATKHSLDELTDLAKTVVDAILPLLSTEVSADSFFRMHSESDKFLSEIVQRLSGVIRAVKLETKLTAFTDSLSDT